MATVSPDKIENEFALLSPEAQLSLLERLVHRAHLAVTARKENWDEQLSAMAADPEIQRELGKIEAEFKITERDGLANY